MTWPIVVDLSNYDADVDAANHTAWAAEFIAAGISGVIIGSQWPSKAHAQLEAARDAGLAIVGTYAEPDADSALALALEFGAQNVGLACERGSILTYAELLADVMKVDKAGLTPWVYGNRGDLISIVGNRLTSVPVWLASYGMNDPSAPRDPITEMDFGYGATKLVAHQFSSTIVVAGRVRDHSYYYGQWPPMQEDTMTPDEVAAIASGQFLELLAQAIGAKDSTFSDKASVEAIRAVLTKQNADNALVSGVANHEHVDGVSGPVKRVDGVK